MKIPEPWVLSCGRTEWQYGETIFNVPMLGLVHFWQYPLPKGYSIQWDGEWKLTLDVFRDLGLAMLVAVVLIYSNRHIS